MIPERTTSKSSLSGCDTKQCVKPGGRRHAEGININKGGSTQILLPGGSDNYNLNLYGPSMISIGPALLLLG